MDLDVDIDLIHGFDIHLPLPYRIIFLIILGVWFWGFNAHCFHFIGLDVGAMIRYPRHAGDPPLHRSVYQMAAVLSILFAVSLGVFWEFTDGDAKAVVEWEILPLSLFAVMTALLVLPINRFHRRGRTRLLRILRRVLIGSIDRDLRFGDLLLSDALTSYAKVLGDLWVTACMFFSADMATTSKPDRNCGGTIIVPLVIALPSIIRLRQCLIEYLRTPRINAQERRNHLLNALKYSSAFPVIILSAIQRGYDPKANNMFSQASLSRLWVLFVIINSFYSFYWDVAMDWDLSIFSSKDRSNPEHPWGLRQTRLFSPAWLYYLAILLDFLLRTTWSIRLSPHLDHLQELEVGIFVMQILEVFRRWMWIFLRIEKEWVSRGIMAGGVELTELEEWGADGAPEGLLKLDNGE